MAKGAAELGESVRSGSVGRLREDGFRVLPAAVPRSLVNEVIAALEAAGDDPRPLANPGLRDLTPRVQFAPAIVAALREELGDEPLAMTCNYFLRSPALPNPHRSRLGPHTHDREIVTVPEHRFLLCWTALQDVALVQGPMWIAPGSHRRAVPLQTLLHRRLEERSPGEIGRIRRAFADGLPETRLAETLETCHRELDALLAEDTGTIRPVLLSAGDAILFDPALIHGTLPPMAGWAVPRFSFLSRYAALHAELFILPPWIEEAEPIERFRLPALARSGPEGAFYPDYVPTRLGLLGVGRSTAVPA